MDRNRLTTEEFVKRAKMIHGNKYDYSKVQYKNKKTKVCIICPEHGEFWQTPYMHWRGSGCRKCGIESARIKRAKSTEQFVKEARAIHGDKYDYSLTQYTGGETPVIIICPQHEKFLQIPNNHLFGKQGCPFCRESHLENQVSVVLKENNIKFEPQKKFDFLGQKSLDFFLPKHRVAIECQGKQHFLPVKHFGGNKRLKESIKNDREKYIACKKHNIKLMYFADNASYVPSGVFTNKESLLRAVKGEIFVPDNTEYIQNFFRIT